MKNFLIYICCECPNKICSKINYFFNLIKQGQNQEKNYTKVSSNIQNLEESNDINNPAKILSSEEINEMIKDQIKYNKEQANSNNGYKIIKQKNPDDGIKTGELINVEEIKKEMNQIEFYILIIMIILYAISAIIYYRIGNNLIENDIQEILDEKYKSHKNIKRKKRSKTKVSKSININQNMEQKPKEKKN